MKDFFIKIRGAREHILKNIDLDIPRNELVIITGVSGSGKSSLAFDTIYAEGQRRYVESLSAYARQFLQLQKKPELTSITGLSPAIAIDQKTTSRNPRSTVGTVTEISDYLRLLFARVGVPFSPVTGLPIKGQSVADMSCKIYESALGKKIRILSPFIKGKKGAFEKEIDFLKRKGLLQVIIDDDLIKLDEKIIHLSKTKSHTINVIIDSFRLIEESKQRLVDALELSLKLSDGLVTIHIFDTNDDKKYDQMVLSEKYACPVSGFQVPDIEPRLFSFNSPYGICVSCHGLGELSLFSPHLIISDPQLSIQEGALKKFANLDSVVIEKAFEKALNVFGYDIHTPLCDISEEAKHVLFYGNNSQDTKKKSSEMFLGIIPYLERKMSESSDAHNEIHLSKYQSKKICESCNGYRLKKEALSVKVLGLHIGEISQMNISTLSQWLSQLPDKLSRKDNTIATPIVKEIKHKLNFLEKIGLNYLSLSRSTSTLSGGEGQRIRLASQIGSGLSGVLYVLDEPSIALHHRDNIKLIETLKDLRDLGNSVIVVEHDESTILAADYVIDLGPGAGKCGGEVVAQGTVKEILENKNSITAKFLNTEKEISRKKPPSQPFASWIEIRGANSRNLKNVDVKIPIGALTVISGVSGSGKSTLIMETLLPAVREYIENHNSTQIPNLKHITGCETFNRVVEVDQSPIGRTPRSTPATYIGLFSLIRDLFANLTEAKARGYKANRFSFNVKGGRCENCKGDGAIKVEMHFLSDMYVQCDICNGERYNEQTLEILYRKKSISDVLNMTVDEALKFFHNIHIIQSKIQVLHDVGLGYLSLGQSSTTLSGGEAQRVKLAKELSRKFIGNTLYILDEPTTGLHFQDVDKLMKIVYNLVESGCTVVMIEHNMDVISRADYVVDIGPEGGEEGGEVVACGVPKDIVKYERSVTGRFLKEYL
ncbi:excinuclease ABC subunit UvrA [Candidatus Sneabacter namystus]|uniref:UvrABC system protein A n=1 Tax=Candidatus Sneabacter namystus TaxID=2601646 RepID=A0A5C0ULV7_9RICK|nr:excinuclease ABC subunit UvrA [Candidatus Sneabacter namystus]QEK39884.1 excinuclease ABC subunit UvrA [Candidatus Sneabacter namystus]